MGLGTFQSGQPSQSGGTLSDLKPATSDRRNACPLWVGSSPSAFQSEIQESGKSAFGSDSVLATGARLWLGWAHTCRLRPPNEHPFTRARQPKADGCRFSRLRPQRSLRRAKLQGEGSRATCSALVTARTARYDRDLIAGPDHATCNKWQVRGLVFCFFKLYVQTQAVDHKTL